MKKLKTAVIGVGYLGQFHTEKYALLPQSELIAVCDVDEARLTPIATQYQIEKVLDYKQLIGKVDAVSIATPTPLHHEIALFFLSHGVHVLLEKPITTTLAQAEELIAAANQHHVVLQIGHLERFNNVIRAAEPLICQPRFIESVRIAPFNLRGLDVNVILDLMIHDIDIIQSIVKSTITHISASGASILSPYIDIASARIEFANGCAANVTANRAGAEKKRVLYLFQNDAYFKIDLHQKELTVQRKGSKEMHPGIPEITCEKHTIDKGDALKDQIDAFLNAVITDKPPLVSGEDGKQALATAIQITQIVQQSNALYASSETVSQ